MRLIVGICGAILRRCTVAGLNDVHLYRHYADADVAGTGTDSLAQPSAVQYKDYTVGSGWCNHQCLRRRALLPVA